MTDAQIENQLLNTAMRLLDTVWQHVIATDPEGVRVAIKAAQQRGLNTTLAVGKTQDGRAGLWLGLTDRTTGERIVELLRLDAEEIGGDTLQ